MEKNIKHNIHQTMLDFAIECNDNTDCDVIAYGSKRISFSKFIKEVDKFAGRLVAMGVGKGDCIAICLPNIPQAEIAFYACSRIGAIASMVHAKTNPMEFKKLLETTKPKLAILTEVNYFAFKPLLKNVKVVFCPMFIGFGFWGMKQAVEFTPFKGDGNEVAVYMHSGGTTGASKTVVLSHRCFNSLVENLLVSMNFPYNQQDTMLAVLPMFHGFGLAVGVHLPICSKMASALVPMFKPKNILAVIKKQKVTVMSLIPRMMEKLLAESEFNGKDYQNIRYLYVGGDALNDKLRVAFDDKLKSCGSSCVVQQGYGLTEMGSVCVLNYNDRVKNSIGQALVGVDARIIDDDLNELPDGECGELIFKSEQLMDGYLNDEETTKNSFVEINGEKWLATGDFMIKDKNGYLFYKGRKKRLIKISGMNVFPAEIEESAKKIDEILHCVAVQKNVEGKPYVCLYVVLKEGVVLDEKLKAKFTQHFEDNLSHWSVPKYFETIEELPHTNFGKVDFKAVEAMCNNQDK